MVKCHHHDCMLTTPLLKPNDQKYLCPVEERANVIFYCLFNKVSYVANAEFIILLRRRSRMILETWINRSRMPEKFPKVGDWKWYYPCCFAHGVVKGKANSSWLISHLCTQHPPAKLLYLIPHSDIYSYSVHLHLGVLRCHNPRRGFMSLPPLMRSSHHDALNYIKLLTSIKHQVTPPTSSQQVHDVWIQTRANKTAIKLCYRGWWQGRISLVM